MSQSAATQPSSSLPPLISNPNNPTSASIPSSRISSSFSSSSSPSPSSSSSSSSSSWFPTFAVAVGGLGLFGLGLYVVYQAKKEQNAPKIKVKKSQRKQPDDGSNSSSSSSSSSPLAIVSLPADLSDRLVKSLVEMTTTGRLDATTSDSLRDFIHTLGATCDLPATFSTSSIPVVDSELIIFVVRWISTYHEITQYHFQQTVMQIAQEFEERRQNKAAAGKRGGAGAGSGTGTGTEAGVQEQLDDESKAIIKSQQAEIKSKADMDLELCWKLLEAYITKTSRNHSAHHQPTLLERSLDVTALEIATRLKSVEKISKTFKKVNENLKFERTDSASSSSFSSASSSVPDASALLATLTTPIIEPQDELMNAFMNAALLGKWNDTYSLGQQLIGLKPDMMREFHFRSEQMSEQLMPDYSQLYELAANLVTESKKLGKSPTDFVASQLRYLTYDIVSVAVEMVGMESPVPQINAQIQMDLMMNPQQMQSQTLPFTPGALPFARTGALARTVSPFAPPMPMIGTCTDKDFHLYGYQIGGEGAGDGGGEEGWFEQEAHGTLESNVNGGKELNFTGNLFVRHFSLGGTSEKPAKGELKLTQKYKVEWSLKLNTESPY